MTALIKFRFVGILFLAPALVTIVIKWFCASDQGEELNCYSISINFQILEHNGWAKTLYRCFSKHSYGRTKRYFVQWTSIYFVVREKNNPS